MATTDIGDDRFIRRVVTQKVERLIRASIVEPRDRDDLIQEIYSRCVKNIDQYDSAKGHLYAFVTTLIKRHALNILRERMSFKSKSARLASLQRLVQLEDGTQSDLIELLDQDDQDRRLGREHRLSEEELADLRMDFEQELDKLPSDLQDLVKELQDSTVSEVARQTRIPRTTIYWRMNKIRKYFQEAGLKNYLEK